MVVMLMYLDFLKPNWCRQIQVSSSRTDSESFSKAFWKASIKRSSSSSRLMGLI